MLISIASTFYNDKEMMIRVLESVLKQTYQKIEHVVTDGGSTDGSVEILQEYEKKYAHVGKKLVWKSEKDKGLYDGFNKAANMTTGEYFLFGTDPYVNNTVIQYLVNELKDRKFDYVYGGVYFLKDGKIIRQWSGKSGNWRLGWMAATPTLCMKRALWKKYGPFDIHYKISADYKFQVKLFQDKLLKSKSINKKIVMYYAGGTSNGSLKANWEAIKECQRILDDCNVKFGWFTNICKIMIALCAYVFASHKQVELK